jgi:hypothetical protein
MLFIQNGAFCNLFDYAHASAYAHVSACPHAHAHTHVSFPNVSAYAHDLSPSPLANVVLDCSANYNSLATIQDEWPFNFSFQLILINSLVRLTIQSL